MATIAGLEIELPHDLLERHRIAAEALRDAKVVELDLRNQITDVLLDGQDTGTHNFLLHHMLVKAVKGVTHSFDQDMISELVDNGDLSDWEIGLLRVKYELKLKDYKLANFPVDVLEQALVVKPSLPTLEIKLGK